MRLVSVVIRHPMTLIGAQFDFGQHVVNLRSRRTHLDRWVDQPGRPHELFDHLRRMLELVSGRSRRNENRAPHLAFELVESQRPIVECRRQPEAELNQRFLPRTVAAIHATELRNRHVRLIDEHQRIGR